MDTIIERKTDTFPDLLPALPEDNDTPIDILDREKVVTQLMELLITLSNSKSSCTFALNGKWGAGKTFVLNMMERQLRDYQAGEKFAVFHYNCWEYDYYDEPLIAIVSAMLDNIDEYTHIFSGEVMEKAQLGFSVAKEILKKIAYSFIENKIGVNANDLSDLVEKAREAASQETEEQHEYDKYYAFHKVVKKAREELSKLAEDQTLVIVVDELDRCLPDYAIKILERLHHLFFDLKNTVLIMALDKTQIEHTITMIFGEDTDCDAYLRKFIDFEFEIDSGTVNDSFLKKYSDYVALFDENVLEPWTELNNYITALFSGMEIRRQEHLVKKVHTIHRLLFNEDKKKDYSFLCFELLMAVVSENVDAIKAAPLHYDEVKRVGQNYSQYQLKVERGVPVSLITYIREHWTYQIGVCQALSEHYPFYNGALDIPLLLIGYSELTYGENGILIHHSERSKYDAYIHDFKAVKRMLEIIK